MSTSSVAISTDYVAISGKIAEFKADHPQNYEQCVRSMIDILANYFPNLQHKSNPILTHMNNWGEKELAFIITDYSGFTNEAIHWFLDTRIRIYWDKVRKEIDRNMGEELGVLTNGIPHLELMRQGHRKDLNIETDNVDYSMSTQNFIKEMRRVFTHANNAFASGGLLAFEATATEEFKTVDKFLRRRKSLLGGELSKGSLTDIYIGGHVSSAGDADHPEDSHYEGLQQAIGQYITPPNIESFIAGFFSVCLLMNIWWEQLTIETYYRMTRNNHLVVTTSDTIDISEVFEAKAH